MATPLPIILPSGLVFNEYPDKEKCIANVPKWKELMAQEQAAMDAETDPDRIAKYEKLMDIMQKNLIDLEFLANIDFPEE